jgi:hypothetical protein
LEEDYKEVLVVWSGLGYYSRVGLEEMNRAVPVRIESFGLHLKLVPPKLEAELQSTSTFGVLIKSEIKVKSLCPP